MQTPEDIVRVLLDADSTDVTPDEPDDVDISPREVAAGSVILAKRDDFIFDWHPDYFGRWLTGSGAYYVSWKKLLHKGKPTFLGTVRQVEKRQSYDTVATVPDLGKYYIASVPSQTKLSIPRGAKVRRSEQHKFQKTRYGHGIVRYRENPQNYHKMFKSLLDAAVYLARLLRPHKHLIHVPEDAQGELDFYDEQDVQSIDPNELAQKSKWFSVENEFVYKKVEENPPQEEGWPLSYYEPVLFDVLWKKETNRMTGKPLYLGTISVEHDERGTPVWGIHSLPAVMDWSSPPETLFASRFGAARVLKDLHIKWVRDNRVLRPGD